jgi:hypothetical protein
MTVGYRLVEFSIREEDLKKIYTYFIDFSPECSGNVAYYNADVHHPLIALLQSKFASIDFNHIEGMTTYYFRDTADEAFYILWANEYSGTNTAHLLVLDL